MKNKFFYLILLALVVLGLVFPVVYSNHLVNSNNARPAGSVISDLSAPGGSFGAVIVSEDKQSPSGSTAVSTSAADQVVAAKKEDTDTGKASPPVTQEEAAPQTITNSLDNEFTLNVAVLGANEEILFGPAAVKLAQKKSGVLSPLDALDATGLSYQMSSRSPGMLEEINGQRNKGQGGWMYKVNDEVPPMAAEKKKLAPGDKVIWWYSKAIDIPPPEWNHLER